MKAALCIVFIFCWLLRLIGVWAGGNVSSIIASDSDCSASASKTLSYAVGRTTAFCGSDLSNSVGYGYGAACACVSITGSNTCSSVTARGTYCSSANQDVAAA